MRFFIDNNTKALWVRDDFNIYCLTEKEIHDILNYAVKNKKKFYEVFSFDTIEFTQEQLILNLNNSDDFKKYFEALEGACDEDGFIVGEPYLKEVTEYDVYEYIKFLYFEVDLEKNDAQNILDKQFVKNILNVLKEHFLPNK